jgi:hypothetical protein
MRKLNDNLFNALKEQNGKLHPLLEYIQNDDTLDMEFRKDYFTLYYRGGEILTVKENTVGSYLWEGLNEEYLLGS